MFNHEQFINVIINPALRDLGMYSASAVELLVFTCAAESLGGTFLAQVNGPAIGVYQMEPATHNDIWQNYIKFRGNLVMMMLSNFDCPYMPSEHRMYYDLRYATAMARLHYARVPKALPQADDVNGLWDYYKTYYNTEKGKATKKESIAKYHKFVKV
jgi:hypothetical protein